MQAGGFFGKDGQFKASRRFYFFELLTGGALIGLTKASVSATVSVERMDHRDVLGALRFEGRLRWIRRCQDDSVTARRHAYLLQPHLAV